MRLLPLLDTSVDGPAARGYSYTNVNTPLSLVDIKVQKHSKLLSTESDQWSFWPSIVSSDLKKLVTGFSGRSLS